MTKSLVVWPTDCKLLATATVTSARFLPAMPARSTAPPPVSLASGQRRLVSMRQQHQLQHRFRARLTKRLQLIRPLARQLATAMRTDARQNRRLVVPMVPAGEKKAMGRSQCT